MSVIVGTQIVACLHWQGQYVKIKNNGDTLYYTEEHTIQRNVIHLLGAVQIPFFWYLNPIVEVNSSLTGGHTGKEARTHQRNHKENLIVHLEVKTLNGKPIASPRLSESDIYAREKNPVQAKYA